MSPATLNTLCRCSIVLTLDASAVLKIDPSADIVFLAKSLIKNAIRDNNGHVPHGKARVHIADPGPGAAVSAERLPVCATSEAHALVEEGERGNHGKHRAALPDLLCIQLTLCRRKEAK